MSYGGDLTVKNKSVGGVGGADFKLIGEPGAFVKKIVVYHDTLKWGSGRRGCLNGIELEFTDGKKASIGNTNDADHIHAECLIDVGKDEKIKSMSLWGMGTGKWDRTSELYLETDQGNKLSAGCKDKKESEYKMETGSGLLIGLQGRAGTGIDSVAPLFLMRVAKVFINNVKYPKLNLKNTDFLQMDYLARATAVWDDVSGKCTIKNSRDKTVSHSFNSKTKFDKGISMTVTASIPELLSVGATTTITQGNEKEVGQTFTDSNHLEVDFEKEMKGPDDAFELMATYCSGTQDIEYTGTYNVETENGQKFSFPTSGTLKQVMCSRVVVRTRRVDEDGNVIEKIVNPSIKRKEDRSLEEPEDEDANGEEQAVDDYNNDGENYEKPREEEEVEEQEGEYTENGDNAGDEYNEAPTQEEETETYDEAELQANAEEEETEAAGYDQEVDEEPVEPVYEDSYENEENEENNVTEYNENLEEAAEQEPNEEQRSSNQYDEAPYNEENEGESIEQTYEEETNNQNDEKAEAYNENGEEEPNDEDNEENQAEPPYEQRSNDRYNEDGSWNGDAAEESTEPAYEEDTEVQSSTRDEYSQSQSYENNDETEIPRNEYEGRDEREEYNASEERENGDYSYESNDTLAGYRSYGVRA